MAAFMYQAAAMLGMDREKKKKEKEKKQQMRAHQSRARAASAKKASEERAEARRKAQEGRARKSPSMSGGKMIAPIPTSPTGATGGAAQAQTVRKTLTGQ